MKPIATVQLPIGKFQVIVSDHDNNEELGKWVRKFARALSLADPDLEPFAAELLQDVENYRERERLKKQQAKERREQQALQPQADPFSLQQAENPKPSGPVVTSIGLSGRMPRKKSVVLDFATDSGLDVIDAGECWEASKEREWKDADGKTIYNWKAFVVTWCRTRKENRDAG